MDYTSATLKDQIIQLSERLNIPQKTVRLIIDSYAKYVSFRSRDNVVTTVLDIGELYNTRLEASNRGRETLAYQARNIADELSLSPILVLGVLNDYREMILHDVSIGYVYTMLHVFTVRSIKNKLHFRRSNTLPDGVRVRISPLFDF